MIQHFFVLLNRQAPPTCQLTAMTWWNRHLMSNYINLWTYHRHHGKSSRFSHLFIQVYIFDKTFCFFTLLISEESYHEVLLWNRLDLVVVDFGSVICWSKVNFFGLVVFCICCGVEGLKAFIQLYHGQHRLMIDSFFGSLEICRNN